MTGRATSNRVRVFWKDDRIMAIIAPDGQGWQAWVRWGNTLEPTGRGDGYATRAEAFASIDEPEDEDD